MQFRALQCCAVQNSQVKSSVVQWCTYRESQGQVLKTSLREGSVPAAAGGGWIVDVVVQ